MEPTTYPDDVPRDLSPEEVRVLGCLVEKEATVPDSYPHLKRHVLYRLSKTGWHAREGLGRAAS